LVNTFILIILFILGERYVEKNNELHRSRNISYKIHKEKLNNIRNIKANDNARKVKINNSIDS
jgi:hypothetical protein